VDVVAPRRFEVYLVAFDPTVGAEIRKTRPVVIVSPDPANRHLRTVIVVPLTTASHGFPSRVPLRFQGRDGEAAIDQMRSLDKQRLVRRLGSIGPEAQRRLIERLLEYFG
jgi:mRNA interferase MazF